MFGVGPVEFMVVLVLALIVFGPEKLPEMMRTAGHAIREFQRYSSELTATFQETTQEFTQAMDVSDVTDAVQEAVESVTVNGTGAHEDVPAYAAEYATADDIVEVPQVSATAVPSEYDTAAAMLEPVAPWSAPEPEPARVAVAAAEPEPVVAADEPGAAGEPVAAVEEPAPKPRRVRKKPAPAEDAPLESVAEVV